MICGHRISSTGYSEFPHEDGRMDRKRTLRCDSKYVHFLMFLLLDGKVTPKRWYCSCRKKFGRSQCLESTAAGIPSAFMLYEDGEGENYYIDCLRRDSLETFMSELGNKKLEEVLVEE